MQKDKLHYNFMYQLRLLNKQYTNHINVTNDDKAQAVIIEIIKLLQQYKIARVILLNHETEKIIVWKTCDFVQKDQKEIVNCEANLINRLNSMGYEVKHNYRAFIIRNYNMCIATYHNLDEIFDYSATLILLHSKMLRYDGIIFMNKQFVNICFGLEHKDQEFNHLIQKNYQSITIDNNIKIYYCFKNNQLIKQFIIIDDFIDNNNIDSLTEFIQRVAPRTPEKRTCMIEIIYLITSYSKLELIEKIGEKKYNEIKHLCCYKIQDTYSSVATHYVQKY